MQDDAATIDQTGNDNQAMLNQILAAVNAQRTAINISSGADLRQPGIPRRARGPI